MLAPVPFLTTGVLILCLIIASAKYGKVMFAFSFSGHSPPPLTTKCIMGNDQLRVSYAMGCTSLVVTQFQLFFSGRTVSTEAKHLNLTPDDLDPCILKHMSQNMGFRLSEIIRLVTSNMPHSATATYHLFQVRLDCYVANSRVQGKINASQSRVANSVVSLLGIF